MVTGRALQFFRGSEQATKKECLILKALCNRLAGSEMTTKNEHLPEIVGSDYVAREMILKKKWTK